MKEESECAMGLVIERAKSGRSACCKCRQKIPKDSPRIRFSSYRESTNMCIDCLRSELVLAGISMVPLTDGDFADRTAARLRGIGRNGQTPMERRRVITFSTDLKVEPTE